MPNTDGDTSSIRTTRSNSISNSSQNSRLNPSDQVSKDDFRNFKDEIVTLFKSEFTMVTNAFQSLEARIDKFETAITEIRTEQERQASELKDLKDKLEKVDSLELISEIEDGLRRKNNVILAGVDELQSGKLSERKEHDEQIVTEIFEDLEMAPRFDEVVRIGRQQEGKGRLLRVTLDDEKSRREILRKAKLLRSNADFKNVYINPDRTRQEQALFKACYREHQERRKNGEDVIISRGKVVKRESLKKNQNF